MRRVLGMTCLFMGITACGGDRPVDLVLLGARIVTLQPSAPYPAPTAVAVVGDRIVYVGDDAGARALIGRTTEVIDLAGACIIPGFADSHGHLYGLGKALDEIDLVDTGSAEAVVERVANYAASWPGSEWIQGRGWDQNDWPRQEFPHRSSLDAVVRDRPVFLRRIDGHAAWANSEALRLAGLTAETPDPPGGTILRDAAGDPTGILVDNAVDLVYARIPAVTTAQIKHRLGQAVAHCLRHGITAVHDAGVTWERFQVYREMAAAGTLQLRVYGMFEDSETTLAQAFAAGPYESDDGLLTMRAVKLYADGALGSRGALLLADYSDDRGNHGLAVTDRQHLEKVAEQAARRGFQVCTHAIGDSANRLVLDLYARMIQRHDLRDHRWRIEHAQILAAEDLPRFAQLGVIAAVQPVHCTSDMDWAGERLGAGRLAGAYAWRSLIASRAQICFGTDFPVERVDPLAGLFAARTRTHQDGQPPGGWQPQEAVDAETALRLYTEGPAYAAFGERQLGRIAPDYQADLTVLDGDPVAALPSELLAMKTIMTIVAGRIRYDGR